MPSSDLFDLAAKITVDHSQSDRALNDTQKRVIQVEREFKKLDSVVKSTSVSLRNDLGNALSQVSPRLGALASAATSPAGAAAAGLVLIASGAGAAAVGIFKLASIAARAGGDLQDMAQQTNFSVRTLSSLKAISATAGTSLESLSSSLVIFQKNLQKSAEGNKDLQATFKALGVTSRDNEEALRQTFTGLARVKDATAQTALAMAVFGRSGKDMLGVIKEIDGNLEETTVKLQKWGLVLTEEDARAADLFSDHLANLELRLGGIARVIGAETLPAFTAFFMSIEAALDANKTNWRSWGETVAKAVLSAEALIGGFANVLRNIDWTNLIPGYGTFKVGRDLFSGADRTAADIMANYNRLVNPNVGGGGNIGGAGLFRRAVPRVSTGGAGGRGAAEPKTVDGWKKALEMLQRVNDQLADEVRRFGEQMERVSASVSQSILDQAFAIKALESNTPDWIQRAEEFIRAKTDEGYIWDADTKRIYLNNAARLEQLRIQSEGATRPRSVAAFIKGGTGDDNFLGAFGKGEATAAGQDLVRRAEEYAATISGTLNNAIYVGFRDGGARGVAALGIGLLDMLNNVFFRRLEEGLSGLFSGSSGGGWGGFFKSLIGIGGSALGSLGGGSFTKGAISGGFAGKFASGGYIPPSMWGIAGERGPEVIRAGTQGATVSPMGGGMHLHLHGVTDAQSFMNRNTQAQIARKMRQLQQKQALTG